MNRGRFPGRERRRVRRQKSTLRSNSIRLALLASYLIVCLVVFLPQVEYLSIFMLIMLATSLSLWFGPLALIGNGGSRKLYDPATIFNLALFYYAIKGLPLAWGERSIVLAFLSYSDIVEHFGWVATYLVLGIITWNLAYHRMVERNKAALKGGASGSSQCLGEGLQEYSPLGVVLLTIIGFASLFLFLRALDTDLFVFFTQPHARAYLSTSQLGIGSPLAYLFLEGVYLLPVASLVWLAMLNKRGGTHLLWWIHAGGTFFVLFSLSPRSVLLSYVISVLIVYHLLIRPMSRVVLVGLGMTGLAYAYLVNVWRGIVGAASDPSVGVARLELASQLNSATLLDFLSGVYLSDIRIFVLLESVYGRVLPLRLGETLLRAVTQLVPRALWPGKPVDLGLEISRLFMSESLSGSPPGFFGEMFMNFHAFGVVGGAALLGAILGWCYTRWILRERTIEHVVFYALLTPQIFLIPSGTISNTIVSLSLSFVSAWLAFALSEKGRLPAPRHMPAN